MKTFASRFTLLALALSTVCLAPAAFAQDSSSAPSNSSPSAAPMHAAPDPQKQAAHLSKKLGLSDDQTSKITAIFQNRQQQIAAARSDSSLSKQDLHAKMHSIQQDSDSQINAVLTPDQQTQYANMKQQKHQRMQDAHSQGGSNSGSSDGDAGGPPSGNSNGQ